MAREFNAEDVNLHGKRSCNLDGSFKLPYISDFDIPLWNSSCHLCSSVYDTNRTPVDSRIVSKTCVEVSGWFQYCLTWIFLLGKYVPIYQHFHVDIFTRNLDLSFWNSLCHFETRHVIFDFDISFVISTSHLWFRHLICDFNMPLWNSTCHL